MEITGLEWEYIDNFEFVVVVGCFLTLTHKCLHTLWYAASAPISPGSILVIAAKAFGWSALLSFYLMFRVDTLIIAGFIGWPIIFLAVTMAVLALASISSIMVYSGLYGRCADRLSAFIRGRSMALGVILTTLVLASISGAMNCFGACREYADRLSPLVRKQSGALRDRLRMLSMRFAQK